MQVFRLGKVPYHCNEGPHRCGWSCWSLSAEWHPWSLFSSQRDDVMPGEREGKEAWECTHLKGAYYRVTVSHGSRHMRGISCSEESFCPWTPSPMSIYCFRSNAVRVSWHLMCLAPKGSAPSRGALCNYVHNTSYAAVSYDWTPQDL